GGQFLFGGIPGKDVGEEERILMVREVKSNPYRRKRAMPAHVPLYQETFQTILALTRPAKVRTTSVCRLALLVTGMIAAQSCVLSRVAAELLALDLSAATRGESIQRRLRRTLSDAQLTAATCYEPILRHV